MRWAALAVVALLGVVPGQVVAATSNCDTTSSGSMSLGNVTVYPNTPVGAALGTPVSISMTFRCTEVPTNASGENVYIQAGGLAARDPADTGSNGILFDTSIPGIALKITGSPNQASARAWIRGGPGSTPGFEIGPLTRTCTGPSWNRRCTATITQTFTAQFVKTGPVTAGTLNGIQLMRFWWYEYGYTASDGPMNTGLTVNGGARVNVAGCSVNTGSQNMTVTLPTVGSAQLPNPGATAGRTRFNLGLTCQPGANASISFATATPWTGATGVVAPGANRARNVGVQLLNGNANPVPFDTAQPLGAVPNGAWSLPYHVQYYRTGSPVGGGSVGATITFTMTYQ